MHPNVFSAPSETGVVTHISGSKMTFFQQLIHSDGSFVLCFGGFWKLPQGHGGVTHFDPLSELHLMVHS